MVKEYNKTVREIFGLGKVAGEVGIEVEVEGKRLIEGGIKPYWRHERDGSLRGQENAEYVLSMPVDRKQVRDALESLFGALEKNGAVLRNNSPNASVHVHLNVQSWTLRKVYTLICLWYILEETLMDWCGEQRVGNLFCLRASDAEAQLLRLASAVRYGRYFDINDQEGLRYAALNYTALGKFGSLEFRGYPALYEASKIDTWVTALLALKDFAEKYETPPEVIMEFSRSGPEDFFKLVLGEKLAHVFATPDYQNQLRAGMRLIQNVAYCVNWEKTSSEKKKENPDEVDLVADEWQDDAEPIPRRRGGAGVAARPMAVGDVPRFEMGPDGQVRRVAERLDPPWGRPMNNDAGIPAPEAPPVPPPQDDLPVPLGMPIGVFHGAMRVEGQSWRDAQNRIYRARHGHVETWNERLLAWIRE